MKKVIALFLGLSMSAVVFADAADDLNKALNHFQTLSANFTQTIKSDDGRVFQTASGELSISRPGHFFWKQSAPYVQWIIVNATHVLIYDPDLEQVTRRRFVDSAGDTPALLLGGQVGDLKTLYHVSELPTTDEKHRYRLESLDESAASKVITLTFSQGVIDEMQMYDALGHITNISFEDVSVNVPMNPKIFDFTPPEGVDILDE